MAGFRGFLYILARILGDVNAVKKGKVGRRVGRMDQEFHREVNARAVSTSTRTYMLPHPSEYRSRARAKGTKLLFNNPSQTKPGGLVVYQCSASRSTGSAPRLKRMDPAW